MNYSAIWDDIFNRHVTIWFGLVVSFLLDFQVMRLLEIDPFGNLHSRLLFIPSYVVMLGYTVLWVMLFPDVGSAVRLLVLGLYLVGLSVLLGWLIRVIRQASVWFRTRRTGAPERPAESLLWERWRNPAVLVTAL